MITFVPETSFAGCAQVLDNKRLGKQRVEAMMLLRIITGDRSYGSWDGHPAVKMWEEWPAALATYGLYVVAEWRSRGYMDNLLEEFQSKWLALRNYRRRLQLPVWWGGPIHDNHREILVFKNPEHYTQQWPETPEQFYCSEYFWPT